MTDGPAPTSTTDALLAKLVDEIVGLRQDLATDRGGPPVTEPGGQIELLEPAVAPTSKSGVSPET